ncbi:hypothetical protein HYW46_04470 [Candidatus Daviesbacteria bacterium]|nr:hypothetical protein [Candidatus Daviesbacteria bacterium]
MMRKFSILPVGRQVFNFQFSIYTLLALSVFTYYISTVAAQVDPCLPNTCEVQDSATARAEGLISTTKKCTLTKFGNDGKCVISNKADITPPKDTNSYSDFKTTFYTNSKPPRRQDPPIDITTTPLPNPLSGDGASGGGIYLVTNGDLTIDPGFSYTGVEVVFVDGNLNINDNINNNTSNNGLVFVVSGDINIALSVTEVDAYLVSFGYIRTAGDTCTTNSVRDLLNSQRLTVRGGLVSLNKDTAIQFCRALTDTQNPAETIIHEPKYAVILQNFLSRTVTITTEDTTFSYSLPHT